MNLSERVKDSCLCFPIRFPKQYLSHFLKSSIRIDGREFLQVRPHKIYTSLDSVHFFGKTDVIKSADSSATVQCGNSVVTCGIKLEVGHTSTANPNHGKLGMLAIFFMREVVINAFFPFYDSKQNEAAIIGELFSQILLTSKLVKLEEFLIKEATDAWVVYADLMYLSLDGSPYDIGFVALLAALKDLRIPEIEYEEDKVVIVGIGSLLHAPESAWCFTYCFVDGILLSDPNADEELYGNTITLFYMHDTKRGFLLCGMFTCGKGISDDDFQRVQDISFTRLHNNK